MMITLRIIYDVHMVAHDSINLNARCAGGMGGAGGGGGAEIIYI